MISYALCCGGCKRPSTTPSGMPSITWRKIDGLWYCRQCADERSGSSPRQSLAKETE